MASSGQKSGTDSSQYEVKLTNLGMQGLDFVLGGGLPQDSVYVLTGSPGTYYITLAQQALYNHVVGKGKVVYYTTEAPSTDIEEDMSIFRWRIRDYIDDGSWVFTRPLPPQVQRLVDLMPEIPNEEKVQLASTSLAPLTQNFLGKLKEERWSALNLSYFVNTYPPQEIADLIMFWVNAVHRFGGVHFLLLPLGVHEERQINYLKSLVDGVLSFKFAQGFGQAEGEIEIEKLRRVVPKTKVIRHVVQSDGLAIETTARIG